MELHEPARTFTSRSAHAYPPRRTSRSTLFETRTTKHRSGLFLLTMLQSTSKIKAGQLWSKNKEDLTKTLGELKTELGQLRIQKIASSGTKLNKM